VDLDVMGRKPGAIAKHASAIGARNLVIVGDRDLESSRVQVKAMATGEVREVGLGELERAFET
jgi:histidyl-tRNA synthetase